MKRKGEHARLKTARIRGVALFVRVLAVARLVRRGAVGGDAALNVGGVCGFSDEERGRWLVGAVKKGGWGF